MSGPMPDIVIVDPASDSDTESVTSTSTLSSGTRVGSDSGEEYICVRDFQCRLCFFLLTEGEDMIVGRDYLPTSMYLGAGSRLPCPKYSSLRS